MSWYGDGVTEVRRSLSSEEKRRPAQAEEGHLQQEVHRVPVPQEPGTTARKASTTGASCLRVGGWSPGSKCPFLLCTPRLVDGSLHMASLYLSEALSPLLERTPVTLD